MSCTLMGLLIFFMLDMWRYCGTLELYEASDYLTFFQLEVAFFFFFERKLEVALVYRVFLNWIKNSHLNPIDN